MSGWRTDMSLSTENVTVRRIIVRTLLITPSGALSPGPLSAMAVALGAKLGPVGGLAEALGHTLFELPYVALLVRGFTKVEGVIKRYEKYLALFVVVFLAWFALGLVQDAIRVAGGRVSVSVSAAGGSLVDAVIAGIVLTGGNVYFLLWWLTVGLPLIQDAARLGAKGFTAMYASHVWMDYAWLALLAFGGGLARLLNPILYSAMLTALAVVLLMFAVDIAARTYLGRRLLPF